MAVANRELDNLSRSYTAKQSNDAKIDHAMRGTEAALKAIVWKHEGWTSWPQKGPKETDFLYRHNLDTMLDRCGLRTRLQMSAIHRASWNVLVNAAIKNARYSPHPLPDNETHAVAKAARHPDTGIVPWLKEYYRTMR